MGGGIVRGDRAVPAFADDLLVEDDERADRHLALLLRPPRELERAAHVLVIGHFLKRASRQASAAFSPCSRAMSMKARLSGEPCDSMAWSMSSARVERGAHALDLEGAVQCLLGVAYEVGSITAMCRAIFDARPRGACPRDHAADDAEGERALGVHRVFAGQEDVLRRLRADHPRQEQRDDAGAELELGLAEGRVARANGDVAGERHLEGARHARAVDRGDGGLGQSQKRMVVEKSSSRISRQTSAPSGLRVICSLRSKPEEKPRPAPESTMTRTSASASRASSASWISSSMPCRAR